MDELVRSVANGAVVNREMKMKFRYSVLFAIAWFACAISLSAQDGCTDSPEDPTVVLALVGSAGVLISLVRRRFASRRKSLER